MSEDDSEVYNIVIKSYTGRQYEIKVSPIDTVQIIKETLDKIWNIPESECILIFNGQELNDQAVLGDIGIQNGSNLLLLLKMAGGPMNLGGRIYSAGLKNLKDVVEKTKKSLSKKSSSGCRVLVLLYKDQDGNHNVMRIFDEKDNTNVVPPESNPKSEETSTKHLNSDTHSSETERQNLLETLREEMRMKMKVSVLRKQMQDLAEKKKLKKMLRDLKSNETLDKEYVEKNENKSFVNELKKGLNKNEKVLNQDGCTDSDTDDKGLLFKEKKLPNEKQLMDEMEKTQSKISETLSDKEGQLWYNGLPSVDFDEDFNIHERNLMDGLNFHSTRFMKCYYPKGKHKPEWMNPTNMNFGLAQQVNHVDTKQLMISKNQEHSLQQDNHYCSENVPIQRQTEEEKNKKLKRLLRKQRIELGKLTLALKENVRKRKNLLESVKLADACTLTYTPPSTPLSKEVNLLLPIENNLKSNTSNATTLPSIISNSTKTYSSYSATSHIEKALRIQNNHFTHPKDFDPSFCKGEYYDEHLTRSTKRYQEDKRNFFSLSHAHNALSSFMPRESPKSSIKIENESFLHPNSACLSAAFKESPKRELDAFLPLENFSDKPIDNCSSSSTQFDSLEATTILRKKLTSGLEPQVPNGIYPEEELEITQTYPYHSHSTSPIWSNNDTVSIGFNNLITTNVPLEDCITDYSSFAGPKHPLSLVPWPVEYYQDKPIVVTNNSASQTPNASTSLFSNELSSDNFFGDYEFQRNGFSVELEESNCDSEEERLVLNVDNQNNETVGLMSDLGIPNQTKEVRRMLPPIVMERKNRCSICKRRLNIMNRFDCRCGKIYCPQHRCAESHNCDFDYKSEGRETITKQNPRIEREKIKKI